MKPLTKQQIKKLRFCLENYHSITIGCWPRGTTGKAVEYSNAECASCGTVAER